MGLLSVQSVQTRPQHLICQQERVSLLYEMKKNESMGLMKSTVKPFLTSTLSVVFCLILLSSILTASEKANPLTTKEVMTMVKNMTKKKLPPSVIITTIKKYTKSYDLFYEEVMNLKKAKVHDDVIASLIEADSIGIADIVRKVRESLVEAQAIRLKKSEPAVLIAKKFELELHVGVQRSATAGAGLQFYVFSLDGKRSRKTEQIQTIRLEFNVKDIEAR